MIAITGANGFIGSALCRHLAARGHAVRPLTRATGYDLNGPPPSLVGMRTVIHCAHDFHISTANHDGTLRLLDSCARDGVEHLVFISSLAAHADAESTYGRGKWNLESQLAQRIGPIVTIVKPGTVLGDGGLFARVRRLARLPVLPVFFSHGLLQTVLIDDLCDALAAVVDKQLPGTFPVAEPVGVPVINFYRSIAALDGRRPLLIRINGNLALPLLRLTERFVHLPITVDNLLGLKCLAPVDTAASVAMLGLAPRDFRASLHALAHPPC